MTIPEAPATPPTNLAKARHPHVHFDAPIAVVDDQDLSKSQKLAALESLEQDARQLATASAEGMGGGEPTKLHEVLAAKAALELPATDYAYDVVLRDLQTRLEAEHPGTALDIIAAALAALKASMQLTAPDLEKAATAAAAEQADEAAREKLDP